MAFQKMFGDSLLTKDGMKPVEEVLDGVEAVGIYFSAHWCPPCRQFTPMLKKRFLEVNGEKKRWAIVYVPLDRSEDQFEEYYGTMPWAAIPYSDTARRQSLPSQFKVSGIPALHILAPDGTVINSNPREHIMNPQPTRPFPYRPPTFAEALGDTLMRNDGTKVPVSSLGDKTLALYFSASWCGPCRQFTPELVSRYEKWVAAEAGALKDKFEVIFVSADKSADTFAPYFGKMPWLAVPFENAGSRSALEGMFEVKGYPSLVIVNPKGEVINDNGRGAILEDSSETGEKFPFGPPPSADVNADPAILNESMTVLLLLGKTSGPARESALAAFKAVAERHASSSLGFRYETDVGRVSIQVRKLTQQLETDRVVMIATEIPRGRFFSTEFTEFSEDNMETFLSALSAGAIESRQLVRQ